MIASDSVSKGAVVEFEVRDRAVRVPRKMSLALVLTLDEIHEDLFDRDLAAELDLLGQIETDLRRVGREGKLVELHRSCSVAVPIVSPETLPAALVHSRSATRTRIRSAGTKSSRSR